MSMPELKPGLGLGIDNPMESELLCKYLSNVGTSLSGLGQNPKQCS
jgi:hypothetical protein